jgi:ankyrin repeat protein
LIVRAAERAPGIVIELLIKRGASVDAVDAVDTAVDGAGGYTALHAAAWNGNQEAAAMLLKYGANPTVRDDKYCATPAGWARYAGHTAVCDVILQGPIDVFDAIDHGRADRIPDVLNRDPDALTRPFGAYASCGDRPDGWWPRGAQSPLSWAVEKQNANAVQILTERGADAASHERDAGT